MNLATPYILYKPDECNVFEYPNSILTWASSGSWLLELQFHNSECAFKCENDILTPLNRKPFKRGALCWLGLSSCMNSISVRLLLIKVFQARGSSLCLQPYGQPITTVLCFMPPRPHDWIRWTTPSRTLDATTIWQKPLTRSISIIFLMAWQKKCGHTEL